MDAIKTLQLKNGINFHFAQTDKFKTNYIGFIFHRPLDKSEVTVNSLLSNLYTRSSESYPNTSELNKRLEELYGTEVYSGVRKKGDRQLVYVNFEFANEKYIGKDQPLFDEICDLAREMIFERTKYNPEYVAQEKENLKRLIMSIVNDKRQYAQISLISEMCKDEPYGIMELGSLEDVDGLDADILYDHYKDVLLRSPIDIFIIGQVDFDHAASKLWDMVKDIEVTYTPAETMIVTDVDMVRNITKQDQVNQGVIAMGFRTKTKASDDDFFALSVYNAIFGGGPYSKLFNNVREKMSLCYYVFSKIDKFKGIMLVNAGIKIENFTVAYDGILEQDQAIKSGNFSDEELTAAKLGIINALRSTTDRQRATEDFFLGQLISGQTESINDFENKINSVTRNQVIDVAAKVQLDTVYFLTGGGLGHEL